MSLPLKNANIWAETNSFIWSWMDLGSYFKLLVCGQAKICVFQAELVVQLSDLANCNGLS